jgi:hypothetical protein
VLPQAMIGYLSSQEKTERFKVGILFLKRIPIQILII